MTYSIIPPVLVVLSVISLILFLLKKAPKIARIEERKISSAAREAGQGESVNNNKGIKHGFLLVAEKITRKLKIFLLKLENTSSSWNEAIKRKRKQGISENTSGAAPIIQTNAGPTEERNIFQNKISIDNKASDPDIRDERKSRISMDRMAVFSRGKERVAKLARLASTSDRLREPRMARPMISSRMVAPRRGEQKTKLERLLIERIAANPKDIEAYERLGEYYFDIGNLQYSKECFKQVIRLDSRNINAKSKMRRLEGLLK